MTRNRRLAARNEELEAREITHLSRITRLEKQLEEATGAPAGSLRRETEMADRIVSLERALKRTQKQLDDALGVDRFTQADIDRAGEREAVRREYVGGAS